MNKKIGIFIGAFVALLLVFFVGGKIYKDKKNKQLTFLASGSSEVFVRDYSPRFGTKDAKVFVIEFLDPECESCRAFYPKVKSLLKEYEGKVQFVVRYAAFHKNSKIAIKALEAAREQGKYWEGLETLFNMQPQWGNHHNPQPDLIFDYLAELGINMSKLREDMKDPKIDEIIKQDTEDLRTLGVRGTPTFFVNGKAPENFGMSYLRALIESEVKTFYP